MKYMFYKNLLLFGTLCLLMLAAAAHAQAQNLPSVLRADTPQGDMLMLPDAELPGGQVVNIDGVQLSIAIEGEFRIFSAIHKGEEQKLYVARRGPPRWLAFDPQQGRFRDVLSSIRVELRDYDQLDGLVEAAGGTSGKAYESLGFAIVHLPSHLNPAEAALRIAELAGVNQASIQLQGPIRVPM